MGQGASAFQISFYNERRGFDRGAMGFGNNRRAISARRIEGMIFMGRFATKLRGGEIAPRKKNAPVFVSKKEAREEFAAVILRFSDGEIATDADVSKETVKTWKKRRAFPQGQILMDLAFNNTAVQNWILGKLGISRMPTFRSPEVMDAAIAGVYRLLQEDSPDGDAARKAMNQRGRP